MSGVAFVEMGTNFSFGAMLPFLCFDEIFPTMHRVEHRQLAAHRTHGPVVSNVFHCKRPSSIIPSLFHLLRKSHYDYATEPFFDLLTLAPRQGLTRGTVVDVVCRIISKVAARE